MRTQLHKYLMGLIVMVLGVREAYGCGVDPCLVLEFSENVFYVDYVGEEKVDKYFASVGQEITFSLHNSYDQDGGVWWLSDHNYITQWCWNFGDGHLYTEWFFNVTPETALGRWGDCEDEYNLDPIYAKEVSVGDGIHIHRYDEPGVYTVKLRVWDDDSRDGNGWAKCTDLEIILVIVKVEVDAAGVPETPDVPPEEDVEYNPGGFISVNNDDDDDDLVVDYDDTSVTGEDNLIRIDLNVWPDTEVGMVRLELSTASGDSSLWAGSNKGSKMIPFGGIWYYREWAPGALPPTLYAEAKGTSGMTLSIFYLTANGYQLFQKDMVTLKAAKLEAYVNSGYSTTLADYQRTSTHPRSAAFMFGKNDPIYVEVQNLGVDAQQAEMRSNVVRVTSSDGGQINLTLSETGSNTQIFRPVNESEYLYLSNVTAETGYGDYIYVDNEPVLTFWLKIQPDSGSYVSCKRVMVDRAEVGGEYQDMYNTYSFASNLASSQFVLYGFYNNFGYGTPGIIWWKEGVNGELNSTAGNWSGGWTESLDLAVWAGHGSGGGSGDKFMAFFVDNIPEEKEPLVYLDWSDIHWGDADMEWVCIHNCHFLDGGIEDLKKMLPESGRCVHMICGYTTTTHGYEWAPGYWFSRYLQSEKVWTAWGLQALYHSDPSGHPVVFTTSGCKDDAVFSNGPIPLTRDPIKDDDWSLYE